MLKLFFVNPGGWFWIWYCLAAAFIYGVSRRVGMYKEDPNMIFPIAIGIGALGAGIYLHIVYTYGLYRKRKSSKPLDN